MEYCAKNYLIKLETYSSEDKIFCLITFIR